MPFFFIALFLKFIKLNTIKAYLVSLKLITISFEITRLTQTLAHHIATHPLTPPPPPPHPHITSQWITLEGLIVGDSSGYP